MSVSGRRGARVCEASAPHPDVMHPHRGHRRVSTLTSHFQQEVLHCVLTPCAALTLQTARAWPSPNINRCSEWLGASWVTLSAAPATQNTC